MELQIRKRASSAVAAVTALVVLALPAFVMPAHAVFTVPTEVTDAATNVGLVGAAVFAIMVGIKLYKWLRRAL